MILLWAWDVPGTGSTHYMLRSGSKDGAPILMEFCIHGDGRRIDYLALNRFWGSVAEIPISLPSERHPELYRGSPSV